MKGIIVFKCGGSSINELSDHFFKNLQVLIEKGWKPVIVHGGGPAIKSMLQKLNIPFEFVDGLRKTTEEMMDVVEMVLDGHVNPQITRKMNEHGIKAVGISGSDMQLLTATPIQFEKYGFVGEVSEINTFFIKKLLTDGIVPVISPVAIGVDQRRYNVNADTAAGAIASAINADQLVFVTDVPGILKDNQLLKTVTVNDIEKMIESGIIHGGMIPKVKAAMDGLNGNVEEVMIVNGKQSELSIDNHLVGTTIKNEAGVVIK